jgi:molybdopterin converting factor small subunit
LRITVRLLASYRQYLPAHSDELAGYTFEATEDARVGDVMAAQPIPADDFFTVLVNGRHATHDQALHEGDVLSVFPAVGGG